jgi:beta-glucanase (GH16 family)
MRSEIFRGLRRWAFGPAAGVLFCVGVWQCVPAHRTFVESSKPGDAWTLVWSDEFNQKDGAAPDSTKWNYDEGIGSNGWGNNELEYYTSRPQNISIQNGNLVITAIQERYTDSSGVTRTFTSARIKTRSLFAQAYGRFEARIKIPAGVGLWPAFWMLGDNSKLIGWPACGEIDVMENIGKELSTIHGTIHGPGYSAAAGISSAYDLSGGRRFADDYHLFAVEWEPNAIRFYVDNDLYAMRTPADLPSGTKWVYDHPFFILLNLAVGGNWPGPPNASTSFPATMLVDYVRVYQKSNMPSALDFQH